MKNCAPLMFAVIVAAAGCSTDESASQPPTLESFGVAHVSVDGGRVVLTDRDGIEVGEIRSTDDPALVTVFRGVMVATKVDGDSTIVTCNGSQLRYPADAVAIDDALSPCRDALLVTSLVQESSADLFEAASTQALAASRCTYIGSNGYCDGTTYIEFHDWWCDGSLYESVGYYPGSYYGCP